MFQQGLIGCETVPMREEHIPAVRELMTAGFLSKNDIWSAFDIKRDQIYEFFGRVLQNHQEAEKRIKKKINQDACLNIVFINNGRITGSLLHYELEDYLSLKCQNEPEKLKLFRRLEEVGKELVRGLDLSHYPKGLTAYINFGSIHPDYDPPALLKFIMFVQINLLMKKAGFRWVIGRISNPRALGLYLKCGGRALREVEFSHEGKSSKLYYFQLDLYSEAFLRVEAGLGKLIERQNEIIKNSKL